MEVHCKKPLELRREVWEHDIAVAPGVCKATLMLDVQHVLDLGVSLYTLGSIFWTMLYEDTGTDDDKEAEVSKIWCRLQQFYKDLNMERDLSSLRLKNIVNPKKVHSEYPCLRFVKAAEARHLSRPVALLCSERCDGSLLQVQRRELAKALVGIYDCIENNSSCNAAALRNRTHYFLSTYHSLAKTAMDSGKLVWNMVPKHHFLEHLCHQGCFEDLKMFWCYSGEDFVGRISRMGHMCLSGKPMHQMASFLVDRYSIGYFLRMTLLE